MATQTTVEAAQNGKATKKPKMPPDEKFWVRYSPHHEAPLSGVSSLTLHVLIPCLVALYFAFFHKYFEKQNQPIPVTGITLGDNPNAGGGGEPNGGAERPPAEAVAAVTPDTPSTPPTETPTDLTVEKQNPVPLPKPEDVSTTEINARAIEASAALSQMSQEAKDRHAKALINAAKGQGGPGKGGGAGTGEGPGVGDGKGPGVQGGIASEREKRKFRWSLRFSTANGRDYADQIAGLGGILAVPEPDGTFRVIRDLKHVPVQGEVEDVTKLDRIFWIDDTPASVGSLTQALQIKPPPPYIVSFFPESLEKRLLQLELGYRGKKEHEIRETRFIVRKRGNSYNPEVIFQQ